MRLYWFLALTLGLQFAALGWEAWHLSLTADEPAHLAAGYMYWRGEDVLYPSDAPPLTRMVSGWVPHVLHALPPGDLDTWKKRDAWTFGRQMLGLLDPGTAHRLIFSMRLTFLIYPLALVFLVWHWACRLFSAWTANLLAAAAALEPTILGHGALIKSDLAAAFGAVLFFYAAWRHWRTPSVRTLAGLLGALAIAVLTKFTLLVVVPLAFALVLWRGPRWIGPPLVLAVFYIAVLAAYQFQTKSADIRPRELEFGFPVFPAQAQLGAIAGLLKWPPQFVRGVAFIGGADSGLGFGGYMLGHSIDGAAPSYFPLAWAIKFPIGLQLLSVAGLVVVVQRLVRRQASFGDLAVWGGAALFAALAIRSHIHLGFRHMLPALPFFILGGGYAVERARGVARWLVWMPILWLAVVSVHYYPQGISYFNEWIGGAENGWKYLADSNIDWGQNLPELAAYVRQHGVRRIKICYFGGDAPERYIPPENIDWLNSHWDPAWDHRPIDPVPGVYAISLLALLEYGFPPGARVCFERFRALQPTAKAGYSIFIYDLR